jgi:hypothetical protein
MTRAMRRRRPLPATAYLPLPGEAVPQEPFPLPPPPQKACWACGGTAYWASARSGRWLCRTCRPPAIPAIVAQEVTV